MSETTNNLRLSYEMQRENFTQTDAESLRLQRSWFDETTVDYWRHSRMFAPIAPLLAHFPNSKWLTVGDGRFGLDAVHLKKMQSTIEVLPTDISVGLLQKAMEMNLIKGYREENAEQLTFKDNEFDFAFCKEAFHHFPRPLLALYEMIRVAQKAVILIEPNERRDKMIPERMVNILKRFVKRMIGKPIQHSDTWNFEESGNYVYCISSDEMEKVALGLQLPTVAFSYYNDYYEYGVEFEKAEPGNKVFERVKGDIARQNRLCMLGLQTFKDIIVILFKESPDDKLRWALKTTGFKIIDLPQNPYQKKRRESLDGNSIEKE